MQHLAVDWGGEVRGGEKRESEISLTQVDGKDNAIYDDDKSCRASLGLDGAEPRPHTVLVDYCWPSFSKNKQIDSIPR